MTDTGETRGPGSKLRRTAQGLLLLALGIAVGVAALELGVRLYFADLLGNVRHMPRAEFVESKVDGVPYVYAPNNRGATITNNLGLRMSRDLPEQKPAGRVRVLLFGDSVAETVETGNPDDLFPSLLEARLRARIGPQVDVLNHAVAGMSFEQERLLLEDRRARWNPDLVVFAYCYNDPIETDIWTTPNFPISRWSAVVNLLRLRRYAEENRGRDWYTPGSRVYTDLEESFRRLGLAAQELPIYVLPLPTLIGAGEPQVHIPVVTALAAAHRVSILDVMSRLEGDLRRFRMSPTSRDSLHYSAAGHIDLARVIADVLAPELRKLIQASRGIE